MQKGILAIFTLFFIIIGGESFAAVSDKKAESITSSSTEKMLDESYMLTWDVLDAIAIKDKQVGLKAAFDNEATTPEALWQSLSLGKTSINDGDASWQRITSKTPVVDLSKHLADQEFVYTYALAQIDAQKNQAIYLGVGSDDAIKIWLNGKLVHANFAARPARVNQDLVSVNLTQGINKLVIKVINKTLGWGFSVHPLSKESANELFANKASRLSVTELDKLLGSGFDINVKDKAGLTALHHAQLNRLTIRAQQLIERGADKHIPLPASEKIIERFFDAGLKKNAPGMAYLAAKNGKVIFKGAKGLANVEKNIPISLDTTFRIGSITKQFTAIALLKLQAQGKLSIDDKLANYFPDFPKAQQVTLRHLLNHTSGIYNYTNASDFMEGVTQPISSVDMISKIKAFDYDFEPGTSWSYSNSGYYLLGDIIEQVSQKSLAQFWQEQFFTPLKMHNTGVYVNGEKYTNEALGYSHENGDVLLAKNWDMTHAGGAGNIYSTVEDLFIWNEALFNGKVLNEQDFSALTTKAQLNDGKNVLAFGDNSYGLGVMLSSKFDYNVVGHGGGLHGFSAYLGRIPDENITFVSLSNAMPARHSFTKNPFDHVASVLLTPAIDTQERQVTKSSELAPLSDYVGEFDYSPMINHITVNNGRLFTRLGTQKTFELFRSQGDHFYLKDVAAELTFKRNEAGEVTSAVHSQNGRTIKVFKMASSEFIPADETELTRLVGRYKLNEQMTMTISKEAEKVFLQATGQPKFELLRLAPDTYRGKHINVKLVFNAKQDKGKTIGSLVLHQSGMKFTANKTL